MITKVGLTRDRRRKQPWLVYWFGTPDAKGKQRKYAKSFKHSREAKDFQVEKQAELNKGAPRDKPDAVTLSRLLDEFTKARLANLSYSTQLGYENTMEQLREFFGPSRPLRAIRQQHAESFIASRKRRDGRTGELSSWSRSRHVMNCGAIFSAAIEWGYTDGNPFKPSNSRSSSALRIRTSSRAWHHITPDEFERLLSHVPTARKRAAFWFMYGCGLRPGEVYNLTIDKIDLDGRRVFVENRTATADLPPFVVKADTQTAADKSRVVPIPERAIPDITEAAMGAFQSGGFVILTPERFAIVQRHWRLCRAGEPWGGRSTCKPWQNRDMVNNFLRDAKTYLRRAGIELTASFDLKTFRKSFAQNLADAGVPPKTTAKLIGDDVRVLTRYYNRVTDANEEAAKAILDKLFTGASRSRKASGGR